MPCAVFGGSAEYGAGMLACGLLLSCMHIQAMMTHVHLTIATRPWSSHDMPKSPNWTLLRATSWRALIKHVFRF